MSNFIKIFVSIAFLFIVKLSFSQNTNELLDRKFWKTKPGLEVVKTKIKEGNNPVEFDANQFDATTLAITSKSPSEVILYLMQLKGNDANKITHDGRTYMFWASLHGNMEVMEYLVKKGTNLKHIDEKGASIAVFVANNGQKSTAVYDYLIKNGADIKNELDKNGTNILLLLSPFMESIEETNYFVAKGLDLFSTDEKGYNIFAHASKGGNKDFLNSLIDKGVDAKAIAKDGGNAFMYATRSSRYHSNDLKFYTYLEELGINPNIATNDGENPLHNLVRSKDVTIIDYFISKGIDVNQQDKDGNTPLMLASGFQKDMEVYLKFFEKGKKLNTKNKEGRAALTYALMYNNAKVATSIIANGADINIIDSEGNDLGYYLTKYYQNREDYEEKLKLLTTFGFCNCKIQGNGNTLYHIAVQNDNKELVRELASNSSYDINSLNEEGMNPMHIAALKDYDGKMLELLIELGASKEIETSFGETPYVLAVENELLVKNKIDLNFLK